MSWEVLPECHWYENRATPHRHTGEKPAPYLIRGRYPVPAPLDSVYAEATGSGVVCWHGRGRSRPRSPYRGTGQAPRGSGRHSAVTGCYFRTNDNKVRRLPCLIESEQLRYRGRSLRPPPCHATMLRLRPLVGLQSAKPHLEDHSTYHPRWPACGRSGCAAAGRPFPSGVCGPSS